MTQANNDKVNIAGLYNRVAPNYGQVGPGIFAYAGQQLVEYIRIAPSSQVLDVGVGRGATLFPAAEKVGIRGHVIGIDLAEQMLQQTAEEARNRHVSNITLLQADAEQLTFDMASFDYVLCGFAIFLFSNIEQALACFFRVLRPGGKLGIIVARDLDALSHWYGKRITEYHEQYHFPLNVSSGNLLSLSEIPTHFIRAGFADIQVFHEQKTFVYADAQQWWNNKWTHGTRYALERMPSDALAQFKSEVLARSAQELHADGIYEELHIQYIIGKKSGPVQH